MSNVKIKGLAIYAYLYSCKGDKDGKTMEDICAGLNESRISCDHRILDGEITQLNRFLYMLNTGTDEDFIEDDEDNVIVRRIGACNRHYYHFNDKSPYDPFTDKKTDLTIGELRFLYDAVLSADFMTEEMVNVLCGKLKNMVSVDSMNYFIKHTEFNEKNRYHTNDKVMHWADRICKVIARDKRVLGRKSIGKEEKILTTLRYEYGYLNKDCKLEKKFDYNVIPVSLVFNGGKYYLVGVTADGGDENGNKKLIKAYRLDRIMSLKTAELPLKDLPQKTRSKIYEYTTRESQMLLTNATMWFGEDKSVTLKFNNYLLGDIFDRYGKKTVIHAIDDDWSYVEVRETKSNAFYAWVFQFGDLMQILGSKEMAEGFEKLLKDVTALYPQRERK